MIIIYCRNWFKPSFTLRALRCHLVLTVLEALSRPKYDSYEATMLVSFFPFMAESILEIAEVGSWQMLQWRRHLLAWIWTTRRTFSLLILLRYIIFLNYILEETISTILNDGRPLMDVESSVLKSFHMRHLFSCFLPTQLCYVHDSYYRFHEVVCWILLASLVVGSESSDVRLDTYFANFGSAYKVTTGVKSSDITLVLLLWSTLL